MRLEDIDLAALEDKTSPTRWGIGTDRDRRLYYGDGRWFKIWGKNYIAATVASIGGNFATIDGLTKLHGFEVGLFNDDIAPAYVDAITDDDGVVRGYVSLDGPTPTVQPPAQFVEKVFDACIGSGWIFSDFCFSNIIIVDGAHSLIDFDTHLVSVEKFDIAFEEKSGALRPHVLPLFRSKLFKYFRGQ